MTTTIEDINRQREIVKAAEYELQCIEQRYAETNCKYSIGERVQVECSSYKAIGKIANVGLRYHREIVYVIYAERKDGSIGKRLISDVYCIEAYMQRVAE
jgi:hypothetical protein